MFRYMYLYFYGILLGAYGNMFFIYVYTMCMFFIYNKVYRLFL